MRALYTCVCVRVCVVCVCVCVCVFLMSDVCVSADTATCAWVHVRA